MASVNDRDFEKASSLTAREEVATGKHGKRARSRARGGDDKIGMPTTRRSTAIWADVVLLVVLVGIVIGGVMGYRALKNHYAPKWEERKIVFVVEFSAVDAAILPAEWHVDAPLYVSDALDASPIGYLMSPPNIVSLPSDPAAADGRTYKIVRLTMHSEARYRKGVGYYCGDTLVLAGASGDMRVDGISGDGMIIAVYEAEEFAALTSGQSPVES